MLTVHSPAKVNLFLRILGKRPDGYHEIASLFQAISLFDTIEIKLAHDDLFTCSSTTLPTDSSNLAVAALEKFRSLYPHPFNAHIHLIKNIPTQAGLGGGSSNAATVLWALNQLLNHPFSNSQLAEMGQSLGSDVPFFLSEGTAFCCGRGELINGIDPLPLQNLWIIKPAEGLSTPSVYRQLNLAQLVSRDPQESLKKVALGQQEYYNDLEVPAFQLMPSLEALKMQLIEHGYSNVVLSGSGTAFFCIGDQTPPSLVGVQSFRVKTINRTATRWYQ